ncbi:MAG: TVP38/TMEM64 family protein [Gammaproteobacteria bacterium]
MAVGKISATNARGRLWLLALLAVAAGVFVNAGGADWLSLEQLQSRRFELLGYAQAHFWSLFVIWGAVYMAAAAFSMPGATVLSLFTGFLFGRGPGTLLIVVAATAGATILLVAARYLFADAARTRLERSPKAARLLAGFDKGAFNYLLFLRLVPVFPFWLVNLASAVTRIPVRTYVVGTAVGILPGSFVFANLGRSLGSVDSLKGLVSAEVLIALGLLGVLSLIPLVLKRRRGDLPRGAS